MPEYEDLLNEYDELSKNNGASRKSGSAFGALDNKNNGGSPLDNIKAKAGSAAMQSMGVPKPLADMAGNKLANKFGKNGGSGNVPEALKKRGSNMPGVAPGGMPKSNKESPAGNSGLANSLGGADKAAGGLGSSLSSMMDSNQKADGSEKGVAQKAVEEVATQGGSVALQSFGVPKPLADIAAKKFAQGPGLKIAIIYLCVVCVFWFLVIALMIYLWMWPILKGLELIDEVQDGFTSFFSSADNFINGNGWCATDAECQKKAEEEFYDKVQSLSNDYPRVDMSLVMASVLYKYNADNGLFSTGNSDYCETNIAADDPNRETLIAECESKTATGEPGTEGYKEAKDNLSKVAKKLSKGKDEFDTYMIKEFIPKNYSEYMNSINNSSNDDRAKIILDEIYAYSRIFVSFMNNKSNKSYLSNICPGGITVLAGSDSKRYPGATNLSLEEYVAGSLSSEYNRPDEPEVMKAVAVAIRSYFVAHINNGGSCTVQNSTNFQTYREPTETTIQIAEETAGQVIMLGEKVIGLHYSIFPGNSADGWSSSTPCEDSVCTDGICTAMLYKDPNNEKAYFKIPQDYQYSDVSTINNSHCHGMSTLVASYLANAEAYDYEKIIYSFVSDGAEITTMVNGEQVMPIILEDPINWRNYTSRTYQIGTATCFEKGEVVGTGCNHLGIDFSYYGIGGAPVLAIAPGTVVISTINFGPTGYGNNVLLGHDTNGDGDYDFYSRYAHLRYEPEVSVGDIVEAGGQLGVVGTTGSSTGDHLHFELYSAINGADGNTEDNFYATQPEDRIDMLARGEVWYE